MRKVTKLWQTQGGARIRICDMTDDHLLNTLRLLDRMEEARRRASSDAARHADLFLKGDMARAMIEGWDDPDSEIDDPPIHPLYDDLVSEALRRRLKC